MQCSPAHRPRSVREFGARVLLHTIVIRSERLALHDTILIETFNHERAEDTLIARLEERQDARVPGRKGKGRRTEHM